MNSNAEAGVVVQRAFTAGAAIDWVAFGMLGLLATAASLGFKRTLSWMEDWVERHPFPNLSARLVEMLSLAL